MVSSRRRFSWFISALYTRHWMTQSIGFDEDKFQVIESIGIDDEERVINWLVALE